MSKGSILRSDRKKERRGVSLRDKGPLNRKKGCNRYAAGVLPIVAAMPRRKGHWPMFHSCGEDNGLELGRVSQRRVKIGLHLAGSHYNNYGRVAGKLHATVPLTVSPG